MIKKSIAVLVILLISKGVDKKLSTCKTGKTEP